MTLRRAGSLTSGLIEVIGRRVTRWVHQTAFANDAAAGYLAGFGPWGMGIALVIAGVLMVELGSHHTPDTDEQQAGAA